MTNNPLLCALAECQYIREAPDSALVRLMMVRDCSLGPQAILEAIKWEMKHGAPTYDKLAEWAEEWWGDPANAYKQERLAAVHRLVCASFTPEDWDELSEYMPE